MKSTIVLLVFILIFLTFTGCSCMDVSTNNANNIIPINNIMFDDTVLNDSSPKIIEDASGDEVRVCFNDTLLKGELVQYNSINLVQWNYCVKDMEWKINGKIFYEYGTNYLSLYRKSLWKIDLTLFEAVGKGQGSIVFYKPKYLVDSDVIIVKNNDGILLLMEKNMNYDPYSYELEDFKIVESKDINIQSLERLWELHLNTTEDDVTWVLDMEPSIIRLRLKSNPALVYEFDYYYYDNIYYPSSPKSLKDSGEKSLGMNIGGNSDTQVGSLCSE